MPNLIPVSTTYSLLGPRTCPSNPTLFAAWVMDAATGYASGIWVGHRQGDEVVEVGTWMAPAPARFLSSLTWLDESTILFGDAEANTIQLLRVTDSVVASAPVTPHPGALVTYLSQYPRVIGTQAQVAIEHYSDTTYGAPHALSVATFNFASGEIVGLAISDRGEVVDTNAYYGHQIFETGDLLVYRDAGRGHTSVAVRSVAGTEGPAFDTQPFPEDPYPGGGQTWGLSWASKGYGNGNVWGLLVGDRVWAPASWYVGTTSEFGFLEIDPHTGGMVEHRSGIMGGDPNEGNALFAGEAFLEREGVICASVNFPSGDGAFPYSYVTFDIGSGLWSQYEVVDAAESDTMFRLHGTVAGATLSGLVSIRTGSSYLPYLWGAPSMEIRGALVGVRRSFTRTLS